MSRRTAWMMVLLGLASCRQETVSSGIPQVEQPAASILLVTLDTTRADAIGPDARGVETPAFNELARRGRLYARAYATAPQTLPAHSSIMTGLYPGGHGVHENARYLDAGHALAAEKLRAGGYATAAFVSSFVLDRRFGLARGFDTYDDQFDDGRSERSARVTTDRALTWLETAPNQPLFVWVHYFDPHAPYTPPEPFRSRYPGDPYRAEVAAMDEQLGRLVTAFERRVAGRKAFIVAGDHGEGLGEHGEAEHGNLVYDGVMRVPLVIDDGASSSVVSAPVSTRRIFNTLLDLAGLGAENSLRSQSGEVVLGEGMIPFLQFGWQPQVMAVEGPQKVIHAGRTEIYDVVADPGETRDLAGQQAISRTLREALRTYPIPSLSARREPVTDEEKRRLASLGYLTADSRPVIRNDAPRPVDMAPLFEELDRASELFIQEKYAKAIPSFERILAADPHNLMAAIRLAVSHSSLGHEQLALAAFRRAGELAPDSSDVRLQLALHHVRTNDWQRARPVLERIVAETPDRLPALEGLAIVREKEGRSAEALTLLQRIASMRTPTGPELLRIGEISMSMGRTGEALDAFVKARAIQKSEFTHDLELGVLFLAAKRLDEARAALDRVPAAHPGYPMALFKRAQVSVLLGEADRAARIARARQRADASTRDLIASERLFQ